MNEYLAVMQKYATFGGRARRREYWMFFLINLGIGIVLSSLTMATKNPTVSSLYSLFVFFPSIAVLTRRLHDIGKSGVWFFVVLIPIVGAIWLLVMLAKEGDPQDNAYGPNPKL